MLNIGDVLVSIKIIWAKSTALGDSHPVTVTKRLWFCVYAIPTQIYLSFNLLSLSLSLTHTHTHTHIHVEDKGVND